ncbi:MAG TPA: serine/threonine-protein kinase [Polyangiaceae bacterium]
MKQTSTIESPSTMSGRERTPLEWQVDTEPETELPVPAGQLLGGKYSVDAVFAEGGMGIVCMGRHVELAQPVAIKFLRRALSGRPSVVQRFLNEARALAALRSEHVVRVMDVGQLESGRPYLVMEHLDGVHLEALLEDQGPLSVETAISYLLQVCEPLAEAHALGIVHRDIKPENLFLWSGGPAKDTVKVLDFGLAKQLGRGNALGVTGPQDSLGSPVYMSPEQITTPHLVDGRSDIWSLGVVAYRLLTNTLPFGGGSLVEVLSHILNAAPRPLSEAVPGLDAQLNAIVMRCLVKDPAGRYATMTQLGDALKAHLLERESAAVLTNADLGELPRLETPAAKSGKIRIPGVHSRWPAVAATLVIMLGVGTYEMDRRGLIRLRDASDGWLTVARLGVDAPPQASKRAALEQLLPFRGVATAGPACGESGARTLCAVRERELLASPSPAEESEITGDESARRTAADDAYLTSQGLTRPSEVAATPDAAATPQP